MPPNNLASTARLWAAGLSALALMGCAQIIKPRLETTASELRAGDYRLDPDHASLLFKVDHLGFSKFVGQFDAFDATLDFSPDDPAASKLSARIDIRSLDVNNPDFAETLLGPAWFDADAYPEAIFESRTIRVTGETTGVVEGELTLRGRTQPVSLDVTFNGGAMNFLTQRYTLGFAAYGSFRRSDFGMEALIPAIGDEVELEIHAEFQRR